MQFVSKLRQDAALYEPFSGKYRSRGPHPKYADKVDVRKMKMEYLKSEQVEDSIRTQVYQATLLNEEFAFPNQYGCDPQNQSFYQGPGACDFIQYQNAQDTLDM